MAGISRVWGSARIVGGSFETMAQRKAMLEKRFWDKGGLRRALIELRDIDVHQAKAAVSEWDTLTVPQVYKALQSESARKHPQCRCPKLP